jgi:hypothetical protein
LLVVSGYGALSRLSAGRNEAIPVIARNEAIPVIARNEAIPVIARNEAIPVIARNEAIPVIARNEAIPVIARNEAIPVIAIATLPFGIPLGLRRSSTLREATQRCGHLIFNYIYLLSNHQPSTKIFTSRGNDK